MILTLIFSFLTSCVPSIFKIFQDWQDNKQQLALTQLQIQANQFIVTEKLDEVGINYELEGLKTRYNTYNSGNKIIDGINALVRPLLAYGFFGSYIGIKIAYYLVHGVVHWVEFDYHIMGCVIGFYYGGRAIEKLFG